MSNHTPGPWFIDDNSRKAMGIACHSSMHWIVKTTDNSTRPMLEEVANLALIAAAPELLEELRECVAYMRASGAPKSIIVLAQRVIEKAEGKQ